MRRTHFSMQKFLTIHFPSEVAVVLYEFLFIYKLYVNKTNRVTFSSVILMKPLNIIVAKRK